MGCMGSDWIYLAWDKFQWQAVLDTIVNLKIP
jgi:hypothetical protein